MGLPTTKRFDAIIVLGNGKAGVGLSRIAEERVRAAVQLFQKGSAPIIIFSGGWSMFYRRPKVTEAEAMKELARKLGCPNDAIITETDSRDTLGNVFFTRTNIIEPKRLKRCLVVTSNFHLRRSKFLFTKVFGRHVALSYHGVMTHVPKHKMDKLRFYETLLTELLREWLRDIQDGDSKAIRQRIYAEHPAYAKGAEAMAAQLREALRFSAGARAGMAMM